MIACGTTRGHMLDVARGTASDAVRLEVESHLEACAACREERAAWTIVGALRDAEPQRLGVSGERRVLATLVAARTPAALPAPKFTSARAPRLAFGVAALALVAGGAALAPRLLQKPPAPPAVVEGQRIDAAELGAVAFGGAGVTYQPGTALTLHPASRTLDIARGEVDVDVDAKSGLPGHFRVTTKRFVVEVLGTRFVVTPTSVRTLRGRVRVLDRQNHEVAVLRAGEWWSGENIPDAAPKSAPPSSSPSLPPPLPPRLVAPPRRATPSVSDLLSRARAALASGDAATARVLTDRALAAGPADAEAPAVELLQADALLVARRPDDAIVAYRRVARRRAHAPEGETAAFAVGQLLFERGAEAEAGAALYDYLARYPHGRFVREARERLAQLHAAP